MLLKLVASIAASDAEPTLPSAPPTISTAIVFRQNESAAINRVASVFVSPTRFASGASCWPAESLPAGRIAPLVVNDLLRVVTISAFAVEESAWILATCVGCGALQLP